jgi:hypothetical protein
MSQIWLVTVPNVGNNNKKTYTSIQELLKNMKLNEIEIPHLVVGTLDSLIALADELSKICSQAEVRQNTFSSSCIQFIHCDYNFTLPLI